MHGSKATFQIDNKLPYILVFNQIMKLLPVGSQKVDNWDRYYF